MGGWRGWRKWEGSTTQCGRVKVVAVVYPSYKNAKNVSEEVFYCTKVKIRVSSFKTKAVINFLYKKNFYIFKICMM